MPTTWIVPGRRPGAWSASPPRLAGAPPALTRTLPGRRTGPGLTTRVAGQRHTSSRQHLRCRRSSSGGEAGHRGRPPVTRADRRQEHQHQPAASPQSPKVTTSRSRGVTRGPGAGPGASSLSTRRGTPMPAGRSPGSLRASRTRTRTGTLLPRGRRALPYPGLLSPRPTRTGPTTSHSAGLQASHETTVRTPVEVPP